MHRVSLIRLGLPVYLAVLVATAGFIPVSAEPELSVGRTIDWNAIMRLPREEGIALAYSAQYARFRPGILSVIFRLWAREDPVAAYSRLRSLPFEPAIEQIESQVIRVWMASDAAAAIAAAANSASGEMFAMAMNEYAHTHPDAVVEVARAYENRLGSEAWRGIIRGIADTRPDLAAEHVAALGSQGEYLLDEFIGHLIQQDPAGTLDWLSLHFPENTDHFDAIATFFFVRSPEEAFAHLADMPDGANKRAFARSLCQAKSVNEESRAASRLPQPPPGYADGICPSP